MRNLLYKALICSIAFSGSAVYANDDEEVRHIEPGTRPLAHIEFLKIQEERYEQDKIFQQDPNAPLKDEIVITEDDGNSGSPFTATVKMPTPQTSVHYTTHQGAFHSPLAVSMLGDVIELEDGSLWVVASGDTHKTLDWLTSDLLVITPNHSWFSSYMFCITNQNTGASVKVNLNLGPIYNGLFTHWIVSINYFTQEICLEDGSVWKLSGFDSGIFNKWLLNDTVIIGVNDGFLSSSKPNILINVNTLTYSRAKCIF